jgi:Icc protein
MSEPEHLPRDPPAARSGVGGVAATLARFDRPRGPGTTFAVLADAQLRPPGNRQLSSESTTDAASVVSDAKAASAAAAASDVEAASAASAVSDAASPDDRSADRESLPRDPSKRRFERALADARRLDVDGILIAGDLTRRGAQRERDLAAECLADAPAPIVAVPGDRDVRGDALDAGDSDADEAGPDAANPDAHAWTDAVGPRATPCAHRIEGVTVLGIDTATGENDAPTPARGGAVTRAERSWIARTARADPDPTICLTHHPIAPLPGEFDVALDDRRHRVRSPARTADVLADAGVELAIGGHLRWPTAARYRGVNAVGAPSTTAFPPSYLLVDVEPRGTTVSLVPLTDWAGLESAYQVAREGSGHGDAIRAAVEGGYFGDLPAVDRQRDPSPRPATPPAPLRRP